MEKRKPTPEEIRIKEETKSYNRKRAGFKKTLISLCDKDRRGIVAIKMELQYLEQHPNQISNKSFFDNKTTVEIYKEAIEQYESCT